LELINLSADILLMLFLLAALAGFLDTLAGGGGLLTIPALMLTGMPPLMALGTNKLQGAMGSGTASWVLLRKKKINWKDIKPLFIASFIGSCAGTLAVQFIDTDALSLAIPIVLSAIAVYFIMFKHPNPKQDLKPSYGNSMARANLSPRQFQYSVISPIGFYDGMFGPGTGSFFALAGVSCQKLSLIQSTAMAKPLNFASNIASLSIFMLAGKVFWLTGLLMMLGQCIGATLGAHCLFKINPLYIRLLIVCMCFAMLMRYFYAINLNLFI